MKMNRKEETVKGLIELNARADKLADEDLEKLRGSKWTAVWLVAAAILSPIIVWLIFRAWG
jgi:hypothetical protein